MAKIHESSYERAERGTMITHSDLPQSLLDSLGFDTSAKLRPINESMINATYCISMDDEKFLLKKFYADDATARSRPNLLAIQRKVAKYGLAPNPVYLCQEQGLYAEEWVTPSVKPLAIESAETQMFALSRALFLTHQLPITTELLDIELVWQQYLSTVQGDISRFNAQIEQQLPLVNKILDAKHNFVFCHNDLALGHILNHEKPIVIDWEYASTGNRYFDIRSSMAINRLSDAKCEMLISEYSRLSGIPERTIRAGLNEIEPIVNLTYKLWYAAIDEHLKRVNE
ncbi:phosphotransferase [Alteromonas sp. ASW11-36]|uniref:Phosphotransferase n=1 Tax=Alteromonas arenosi TaxID=3055817 RepID=A0ABT7SV34_9ALTE|nr:phosphotransferase [Alteromonas sp. ASW11-36]MDM7860053.1 phosphotransferase [Alteromonas sp. ASW11-36]